MKAERELFTGPVLWWQPPAQGPPWGAGGAGTLLQCPTGDL